MRVYFGNPIDQAHPEVLEDAEQAFAELRTRLQRLDYPVVFYHPAGAFWAWTPERGCAGVRDDYSELDCRWLIKVNERALTEADAVVLLYYPGVPTWGLPQELLLAELQNKHTYVWLRNPLQLPIHPLPVYLVGRTQAWLCEDLDELYARIKGDRHEECPDSID